MLPYFALLTIVSLSLFASYYTKSIKPNPFFIIAALSLWFFAFLRYDVGVDFNSYLTIYENYTSYGSEGVREPLYNFLMMTANYLNIGFPLVLATAAALFIGGFYFLIVRYSAKPELSFFLFSALPFLYLASFNQVRQYAALGVLAFAIHFLIQRKPIAFFSAISFAGGFHFSAIMLFPIYFFFHKRYTFLTYSAAILAATAFLPPFLELLYQTGIWTSPVIGGKRAPTELSLEHAALFLGSIVSIYFLLNKTTNRDAATNVFLNFLFCTVALVFLVATTELSGLSRATSLLAWVLIFTVPLLLAKITPAEARFTAFITILFITFFYFWHTVVIEGSKVNLLPYSWILN